MNKQRWQGNVWMGGLIALLPLYGGALANDRSSHVIHDMASMYGISEEAATDRLASEIVAASQYQLIRNLDLNGYAGGWYDADSARLVIATTSGSDRQLLSSMNIDTVLVNYDLPSLQGLVERIADEFQSADAHQTFRSAFVDVRANKAVLVVAPEAQRSAKARVGHLLSNGRGTIRTKANRVRASSGPYRGADGTRNLTWSGNPPCSIGASTENGFVWAGHCGHFNNKIGNAAGTEMGDVVSSSWVWMQDELDAGKVQTNVAWTPTPTVQGYNHGVITVSSILSGLTEFPVGSTVCRYGGTSQWGSCGTVDAKNLRMPISGKWLSGVTQLTGMCSDDGDSGGPHVAGGSHIQGVNVGKTDEPTTCPDDLEYVYLQPMPHVLDYTGATMLTSHGANAPSAYNLNCPDAANSGGGQFFCTSSFKSQGATDMTWTYGGNQFSGPSMFGRCSHGGSVSVGLTISNPYGTDVQNISFPCPSGPIP